MKCLQCGFEMEEGVPVCPNCEAAREVRVEVLPPEEGARALREPENFQGLTLRDQGYKEGAYEYQSECEPDSFEPGSRGPGRESGTRRVYVRQFTFGRAPGGILGKLIIAAVLIGLVIVALPLALLGIGLFLAVGLLARLRGR